MSAGLCIGAVINAAFYVLQHLTRIYFMTAGGAFACRQSKTDVLWFSAHTLGMLGIAALILIWTVMLPVQRQRGQGAVHWVLACTAALNLVLAAGVHGALATKSVRDHAEIASCQAQRAGHCRLSASHGVVPKDVDHPPESPITTNNRMPWCQFTDIGRAGGIRTHDLFVPKENQWFSSHAFSSALLLVYVEENARRVNSRRVTSGLKCAHFFSPVTTTVTKGVTATDGTRITCQHSNHKIA
ncbi:MAG: hypothetical protein ACO1TE_28920 [Prosthecobacter sp.]